VLAVHSLSRTLAGKAGVMVTFETADAIGPTPRARLESQGLEARKLLFIYHVKMD
jgi:hypothetical protein